MERSVYLRLDQLKGEHWWFCARRSIPKSVIERFAPLGRKLRLLEAGCGSGGNLRKAFAAVWSDYAELDVKGDYAVYIRTVD